MSSIEHGGILLAPTLREGGRLDGKPPKKRQDNASTGVGAATMRVLTARALAFWFRAPMKAFFRSRVDYMVGLRDRLPLLRTLLMAYIGLRPCYQPKSSSRRVLVMANEFPSAAR